MARPIIAENPPIINVFVGGNGAKIANRFMAVVNSFSKIAFNCLIHRWKTDRFTLLAEFREQSCARHHRELSRPIRGGARCSNQQKISRGNSSSQSNAMSPRAKTQRRSPGSSSTY
jgi:hypothetical protein